MISVFTLCYKEKSGADDIAFGGFVYIRSWRSRITQQIPILKIGGSNPSERAKKKHLRGSGDVFYGIRRRDSNPERVSGVKKTVRGTVYRREGRDGYCRIKRRSSRSEYAQHTHSSERAKKKHLRGSGDVRLSIKHLNHALKTRYVLLYQKKVFY